MGIATAHADRGNAQRTECRAQHDLRKCGIRTCGITTCRSDHTTTLIDDLGKPSYSVREPSAVRATADSFSATHSRVPMTTMSTKSQLRRSTARAFQRGGMGLLLFGLAISWSASVEASCGDYVVIGNPRGESKHSVAAEPHMAAEASPDMPPGSPSHSRPCQGPGCQQDQPFPPLPVPAMVSFHPEFAAMLQATPHGVAPDHTMCVCERRQHGVDGALDRIERPPQVLDR